MLDDEPLQQVLRGKNGAQTLKELAKLKIDKSKVSRRKHTTAKIHK